ncbi:hypothetical protein ACUUYQ_02590 [Bacillus halotolerans]|nr:hypothetical protein [Bacillus subtilis]
MSDSEQAMDYDSPR